jgi:hypothetical protein
MRRTLALLAKSGAPGKRPRGSASAPAARSSAFRPAAPDPATPPAPALAGLEGALGTPTTSLVQRTSSPWVWATMDMDASELSAFAPARLSAAEKYFRLHGGRARFVEPEEFNYEVDSRAAPIVQRSWPAESSQNRWCWFPDPPLPTLLLALLCCWDISCPRRASRRSPLWGGPTWARARCLRPCLIAKRWAPAQGRGRGVVLSQRYHRVFHINPQAFPWCRCVVPL